MKKIMIALLAAALTAMSAVSISAAEADTEIMLCSTTATDI